MRRIMGLSAVVLLLAAGAYRAEDKVKDKVDVKVEPKAGFIGNDLVGWEGIMEYWSFKDGALIGKTEKDPGFNTFLCSKKTYKDFELTFKVRLKDGIGNSGVQVRSKMVDKTRKKFTVHGPQCDIGQGYWGSLYGEGFGGMMQAAPGASQKVVKQKDFNDYYIKVVGKHVTIKVNGETTVDQDFGESWAKEKKGRQALPDEGIIAFQLHAGFKSMEVTFKDVTFKELKSEK
jgi:hypothetical protein